MEAAGDYVENVAARISLCVTSYFGIESWVQRFKNFGCSVVPRFMPLPLLPTPALV